MRIGLDARFLTHPQRGGFKTYTQNLIEALRKIDQTNDYVIYVDRPIESDSLPQADNFHYCAVESHIPIVGMPAREQITLRQQIQRDKLDFVHFLCNTAPAQLNQPYILTLHDTIQVMEKIHLKDWFESPAAAHRSALTSYSKWAILQSARGALKIITVSHYEQDCIKRVLSIPLEQIEVTHLAPNRVFRPLSVKEKNQFIQAHEHIKTPFIMGVGYETRKNIPLLIEAFSAVSQDIGLVIVIAHEKLADYYRELARAKGIEDRVTIIGSIPPEQLVGLYNLAEIFVFPSDRESFGLPPLEALACGTPVIAMNSTSLPEILGNAAVLIDGKDVDVWAGAISALLADESHRAALSKKALAHAASFSWEQTAKKTLDVYETVLAQVRMK